MTVTFGFYNSLNGDRKYDAVDISRIFEGIITNGIFQSLGSALAVTENPGTMTVTVGTGRAWFDNTWTNNDTPLVLTLDASEAVLNRIDVIVLEVNSDIAVRQNSIKILKGTPASAPLAPSLANTSTLHQYALANITVNAGVTQISTANIANKRGVTTPFITGILTSIDSTTLIEQWEAQFQAWFTNLQNQLDSNQAANLQNQIDQLTPKAYHLEETIIVFTTTGTWTKPSNLIYAIIEAYGSGGAGGGAGGGLNAAAIGAGGGEGGYGVRKRLAADLGASENVVVGVGGTGVVGGDGGTGGSTSFGSHIIINGGAGGVAMASGTTFSGSTGGVGGGATNADYSRQGAGGFRGTRIDGTIVLGGIGGGKNTPESGSNTNGANANSIGAGGNGGKVSNNATSRSGGNGGPGLVIIHEFRKVV